jgi:hypothetical protein
MTEYYGTMMLFGSIYLAFNTIPALIAGFVWAKRGGEFTDGFWIGLFLSVVGIFIAAIVQPLPAWSPSDGRPMAPPAVA